MTVKMIGSIAQNYKTILNDYTDYRVRDWPLMSSPLSTLGISLMYPFIVKVLGPWLMKDRKPFQLRKTLIIYNLVQVLFSTWIFSHGWNIGVWSRAVRLQCGPPDYSMSPEMMQAINGGWWFFISKFSDFFDTFFFIMRKKYNQVSTLHVIHHGIMPLSIWVGANFAPGLDSMFVCNLNSFVHMVMYTYYMLSAIGPHMQKYLWWKKYLTLLQLVQFVTVFSHMTKLLLLGCEFPRGASYLVLFDTTMFFLLFFNFYQHSYTNSNRKNAAAAHKKTDDCANVYAGKPGCGSPDGQTQGILSGFTSCFLPAINETDTYYDLTDETDAAYPPSEAVPGGFVSDGTSLDGSGSVSRLSSGT